jgi:hypothetical protein
MSRIKSVKALSTTVAAVLAVVALVVGLGIGALALGGLAGPREVTVTRTVVSTVTQTGAGTTVTVTGAGTTVTVTQTATVRHPGRHRSPVLRSCLSCRSTRRTIHGTGRLSTRL